jgi:hypothetical protein
MMAKKQLSDAFKNAHGQLRAKAKKQGMVKGDTPLSTKNLQTLSNSQNPKTRKQAQAALNMKKARGK